MVFVLLVEVVIFGSHWRHRSVGYDGMGPEAAGPESEFVGSLVKVTIGEVGSEELGNRTGEWCNGLMRENSKVAPSKTDLGI